MHKLIRSRILLAFMVGILALVADHQPFEWAKGNIASQAEARVGRPATPGSAAGVARRTTRRIIRRTTVYIAVLPAGCTTVVVDNVTLHYCGGAYYQPYRGQYVVVIID